MASTANRISGADVQITGTMDMRGNRVTGLPTDVNSYPLAQSDGATKAYVDFKKREIQSALPAEVNNGTF
jgi:hypothetical protein